MSNIRSTIRSRRYWLAVAPVAVVASLALIAASMLVANREPPDAILFRLGMALMTLGGMAWMVARAHATDRQLECIRQAAYDDGYSDGCEVARVVQMRRPSAVVPVTTVASDSAAQQLGDQRDVGQGA